MNLSEMRAQVLSNIIRSDILDTQIDSWLNDAQRKICRSYNFSFMESEATRNTVASTASYSLPDAGDSNWTDADGGTVKRFKAEIACWLKNGNTRVQLTKRFREQLEREPYLANTASTGTPDEYSISQGKIRLFYTPSSVLTIDLQYYGFLATLSGDSASNDISSDCPEALIYQATAYAFGWSYEDDRAQYWENKANEKIMELITLDKQRVYGSIESGIRPSYGQSIGELL